jgi:hypothetical protein
MAENFDLNAEVQKLSTLAKQALSPGEIKERDQASMALGDEVHKLCKDPAQFKQVADALTAGARGFVVREHPNTTGADTLDFKNPYGVVTADCNGGKGSILKMTEK